MKHAACTLLALALSAGAATAQVLLDAGDTLRLSVAGLPGAEFEATVGLDGTIDFPVFGQVNAANRTVREVRESLRTTASGKIINRYNSEGVLNVISISGEDLVVTVVGYRPVIISGEVAQPREIPFREGLTVRAVLALSGGTDGTVTSGFQEARQVSSLQTDYAETALEHAEGIAVSWRLNAALEGDPSWPTPDFGKVFVSESIWDSILEEQRKILETELQSLAGQRQYLSTAVEQARERQAILVQQEEGQREALAADEAEQARIAELAQRGLVQVTRTVDVRRAVLLSSTRYLETQDSLARVRVEIERLEREIAALDERQRGDWIEERAETDIDVLTAAQKLGSVRELLRSAGVNDLTIRDEGTGDATVRIFRREAGVVTELEPLLDDYVQPGDIVDVSRGE